MTKLKVATWDSGTKNVEMKFGSEVLTLKATNSLFARLLIIARSARDAVNLEEVIGIHEFASRNCALMTTDGSVHPTQDKSQIRQLIEELPEVIDPSIHAETPTFSLRDLKSCLIVDGMAVVHELIWQLLTQKHAKSLALTLSI